MRMLLVEYGRLGMAFVYVAREVGELWREGWPSGGEKLGRATV